MGPGAGRGVQLMEHPWAQARGVGLAHVRGNKQWAWAVCGDWGGHGLGPSAGPGEGGELSPKVLVGPDHSEARGRKGAGRRSLKPRPSSS